MGGNNSASTRRSLPSLWLDESMHPVLAFSVVLGLEAAATLGLVWWAGWRDVWHALAIENARWFALCALGQVVAYVGYTVAFRSVVAVEGGVELGLASCLGIVSVGFAPVFSASRAGGFSVDLLALREAGMSRARALARVLALSALEYAVLAPVVAACGLLLFLHVGGVASADIALPWLAVVPGACLAAWLTSPKRGERFRHVRDAGRLRRGFAYTVAALTVLRTVLVGSRHRGQAFAGAALYWVGDMLTLWAALRVFDVRLSMLVLVLAYGTGWALTRRSLPFGGPGVVEVLLAYVLTWFHIPFASAAAGVVGYRLFNLWLAFLPAAAVLPFAGRLQRGLDRAEPTTG